MMLAVIALVLGGVIIMTAINNTYRPLFTLLGQDLPGFAKWAVALFAVGMLQYIPEFGRVGRALFGLVLLALFVSNYKAVIAGFQAVGGSTQAAQADQTVGQQFAAQAKAAGPLTAPIVLNETQFATAAGSGGSGSSPTQFASAVGGGSGASTATGFA